MQMGCFSGGCNRGSNFYGPEDSERKLGVKLLDKQVMSHGTIILLLRPVHMPSV